METLKIFLCCRTEKKPFLLKFRSAKWFIVLSVSTAVFSDIFLYGIIVPVIPFALESRAGTAPDQTQYWVSVLLTVYSAFLLAFSPISGWIADRTVTRRMPLLVSLFSLGGATVLLMLGRTIGVLIAGRALQGISAAAVWSIGLALLVDTVGADGVGEAMGYVSLSMALGVFCAPLLGGVVYERSGYYAVYYMAYGVVALDILLRLLIIEKKEASKWLETFESVAQTASPGILEPNMPSGALLSNHQALHTEVATLSDLRDGCEIVPYAPRGQENIGINSAPHPFPTRVSLQDDHIRTSAVSRSPRMSMPPVLTLLASHRLLASLWGAMATATVMTSFDTVLPLRVAQIFRWDSIGAGLIFLAVVVPSLLNPLVGKLADRYGPRLLTTVGLLLNVPLLTCLRFVDHNSIDQKVLLCALLAMLGLALSSTLIPLMAEITWAIDARGKRDPQAFGKKGAYAQGYGLMNAAYAAGTLIGPLWSGFVNDRVGWSTMNWTLALFSGVSAFPVFLFLGGWVGHSGLITRNGKHPESGDMT